MGKQYFLYVFFILCLNISVKSHNKDTLHSAKLEFIENKGQWNNNVLYQANLSGGTIFLEKNCFTFSFEDPNDLLHLMEHKFPGPNSKEREPLDTIMYFHAYKVNFENSNENVEVLAKYAASDYNNYFMGKDRSKWKSFVKKYKEVYYKDIWENIDLKVYDEHAYLKYDLVVHPGASPKDIVLNYEGVEDLSLNNRNLIVKTSVNKIIEMAPYCYQIINNEEKEVECRFKIKDNKVVFKFPKAYNKNYDLIIDPVLVFSSYSGSTVDNWGYTATYDDSGYVYAGGNIRDLTGHYPTTPGAYQLTFAGGATDIAITKYDTNGQSLIYSTYLGGNGAEIPHSLIVNNNNELYILGTSSSTNFPTTPNAYDTTFNGGTSFTMTGIVDFSIGSDIVISRLSSNGASLLSSTYYGGNGNDGLNINTNLRFNYADEARGEIMFDNNNNIYVISSTYSTNFPISSGAFQSTYGGQQDACIFKLDQNLSTQIWSSYLGGSSADAGYSIALDKNDNLYVSGGTTSLNFPVTSGTLQPNYGGGRADGFISHISKNGNALIRSTYYGSDRYDQVYFVKLDKPGNVYVLGQSADTSNMFLFNSTWFTTGGGQFISKLSKQLNQVIWSTKWGTNDDYPDVSPTAFMVDLCNSIYLSAWGGYTDIGSGGVTTGLPITSNAFQTTTDGSDYYFMVINDNASYLVYATFFGGSLSTEHVDGGTSRFDKKGRIYQSVCAGCGGHSDFPTTTPVWSNTNNSFNCNNAVIKFDFKLPVLIADFSSDTVKCAPDPVHFTNKSYMTDSSGFHCYWNFGNGQTSTQVNPIHSYTQSGVYTVTLIVSDTGACNFADTISKQLVVLSGSKYRIADKHICKGNFTQIGLLPTSDPSLTYNWSPGFTLSNTHIPNPIASPLSTTDYTLYMSNGVCTDTILQKVIVYDLKVDAGNDTTLCVGNLLLTAHTYDDTVMFHWSDNLNFTNILNTSLNDSNALISITSPKMFYVKLYNNYGCEAIDSVYVDFRIYFSAPTIQMPKCNGDANGQITIHPLGGAAPYQYLWSNSLTTQTITGLAAGTYTVTVYDADSCFSETTVILGEPAILSSNMSKTNAPCHDVCIGEANTNTSGGTMQYSYNWSNGQTTNPATNLCDGIYFVTITDANQCVTYDTVEIVDLSIGITVETTMDGKLIDFDTIYQGQSIQLRTTYLGPTYSYTWTPPEGLSNPNIYNPLASPNVTTTYYVLVEDQYGCQYMDSVTIFVIDVYCDKPYIYLPNAFTPDGDHINDVLYLRSNMIYDFTLQIFNRWGELVFETTDINKGWDGTYKGEDCNPGVFAYQLNVVCHNKQIFKDKGNITLIR
ncbi:MAG: gliding motility-associated C-terminal domain-containing protein [Saprospiraceae bacterium]|nr:gliding motility-associated C-terminal domain-containing protein [Saprospiraceae bacterium]